MVTMEVERTDGFSPTLSRDLDELQYSRLIYTLGREAAERLCRSRVLIVGCRGLGAEVAKNLVLSGIGGIGLADDGVVSIADLGSHFLLRECDVGRNRAISTAESLKELNPLVDVAVISVSSLEVSVRNYQLLIATSGTLLDLMHLNRLCRLAGVMFIATQSRGLFSYVFVDLGELFWVTDETGAPATTVLVAGITQDYPATVTVVEEQRHGLEDGDEVIFKGIKGMEELNRPEPYRVSVTGTHTFTIPEDTRQFDRYLSGGYFHKVKPMKALHFLPLEAALHTPEFSANDSSNSYHQFQLHAAFRAIDEFERLRKSGSIVIDGSPFKEGDIKRIVALAREIWQASMFENGEMDLRDGNVRGCEDTESDRAPRTERETFKQNGNTEMRTSEGNGLWDGGTADSIHDNENVSGDLGAFNIGGTQKDSDLDATRGLDKLDSTTVSEDLEKVERFNEQVVEVLGQAAHTELCPLVVIIGGIAAQEVIKAVGKVFMPLHQWLYFDAIECAPTRLVSMADKRPVESRYDLQIALFGNEFQQKLNSLQWLVIGAGGIGCEVLKNLVLMGVGCYPNGSITLTDMDFVAKPNLTDQLLYRADDIGRKKTTTAGRALRRINPMAQIHALQEKFDVETESIFDSSFFQSISGVLSAVDTASSRLYIDMRCVTYRRPMIDGGRHGAMGSVQVFVPLQSEMYASTHDPPENKESPICTLRNFPYTSEHTVRWAVEMFESLFKQRPDDVNSYLSSRDFQESIRKANPSSRLPILETLRDALLRHRPLSFESCVHWARLQFEDLFSNCIKQLHYNFPEGMITTAGTPFWSGTKRIPTALEFDTSDSLHMDFIVATANLQATVYGLKGYQDRAHFFDILQNMEVPIFQPKEGVKIALTDNELRNVGQQKASEEDTAAAEACETVLQELPTPATLAGYRLCPINFEKDDEHSFHTEFVLSAANLRARNYGIPASNTLQARLVGGRVIPSIVTSTAVVAGLMCLELYKIIQNKALTFFKHSYFNLALPFFSRAEPIKAIIHKVNRSQHGLLLWTLWDKFEMDCVGMSLQTFLVDFKKRHGLDVTMISYGKSLLFAEFLVKKKLQERMPLTFLELIASVGKVTIPPTETKVMLSISCTDAYDNDVEVPDVIAQVR